ncbi:hypothetical protein [Pelotalea chapellei]|uniref:Uncharacterized protein n=1 Tax=Pelotalea chapellei TaxID=44671 RepID=A0ABS5U5Q9_9BACT|nr:hypothetical protein [Pelotalea chapellei]MBT1070997.1 hypothetical protein [Pelotalea chapellei]
MTGYRARDIDELLQDPDFLTSPDYQCYQNLVDQGAYPTVKDAILSFVATAMQVRVEDHAAWSDEINAAIEAEREGRIFPPMPRIAGSIADVLEMGTPHLIPEPSWRMLIDFLCGTHRGKKGRPRNDFDRDCDAKIFEKYERLLKAGFSPSRAQASLEATEQLDRRTVQRTLDRAKADREGSVLHAQLATHDMTRFFLADDGGETDGI